MTAPGSFLPYGHQSIDDDDVAAVVAALRGEFLTGGPTVVSFEQALCAATGARHAVVCSSGTAGLHLAALALGLGEGDVVIVPSLTFLATANAARYVGAEVVFSDVDPETGLMRVQDLDDALVQAASGGRRVKAVFPVHLNGQPADPAGIHDLARRHGLSIVEDASHALGTRYGNGAHSVGACSHADATVFSFHPVKTATMAEGGAVTVSAPVLKERLARFRNHGMIREPEAFTELEQALDASGQAHPWYYEMPEIGFNYRATDLQCALGLRQMAKLDGFLARRRALVARYDVLLADMAPLLRPVGRVAGAEAGWHLYVVHIRFDQLGRDRATVMKQLRAEGIGTQVHYLPVHRQPYYRKRYGRISLPGADAYYDQALSLPLYPDMTEADQDRVVSALSRLVS
ncbi:UDP-4-amino-4,6-dideoxy-N-acetyl-beta-L-altrosamine transaminase [Ferrovibrio sp.]|uniref:UDP-4-amino-4, 6-dideoxy-N-acetyl-beta-L-altrosamine transaminase n=1 Tax=Ferrovibrio sp. TaxID=1917215 RepID=UPI000CC46605|nr:UDP-4-amino-4,6-dideoxy-N-acetyl-beta-L-altrosamine transaminase [Ferrovibrio sp.]PJI41891.1 MAG: UDP-4-amino-4,6-dideoxy-N-acetyl-beta-L-altrosamine transaminase [Ferrovibrio sp.]